MLNLVFILKKNYRFNSLFCMPQHITSSSLILGDVSCWVSAWWLVSGSFLSQLDPVRICYARLSFHTPGVGQHTMVVNNLGTIVSSRHVKVAWISVMPYLLPLWWWNFKSLSASTSQVLFNCYCLESWIHHVTLRLVGTSYVKNLTF